MNALGFAPIAMLRLVTRSVMRYVASFSPAGMIVMLSESIKSLVRDNAEHF